MAGIYSGLAVLRRDCSLGKPDLGGTSQGFLQGADGHHFTLNFHQLSKWVGPVEGNLQAFLGQMLGMNVFTLVDGIGQWNLTPIKLFLLL